MSKIKKLDGTNLVVHFTDGKKESFKEKKDYIKFLKDYTPPKSPKKEVN